MNDWLTDWLNEVVSEWVMCWNWNEMFGQLPDKDLLDLSGLRWSKGLCTNYEKMSLLRPVALEAEYTPPSISLSLFCGLHPLTHCCVILLLYYSKLTVEWVKWPVQQGCCCHCCLCCSLSVSFSACLPGSLPVCPPVYPHICVRKYVVRVFAFALLPFSLNWHLF